MKTLKASILAAIVAWSMLLTACSPKQLETFKAVSSGVVITTQSIQATLNGIIAGGSLTPAQVAFIQDKLSKGIALVGQLDSKIQTVTKWPPENAQEIIDFVSQVISFINDAAVQSNLQFGSSAVMQKVALTLAILQGALATIRGLLTPNGSQIDAPPIQIKKAQSSLSDSLTQLKIVDRDLKALA